MSKRKKFLIVLIILLATAGVGTGGYYGYNYYQQNSIIADVYSVESVRIPYYQEEMTSSGMVTNDSFQDVHVIEGQNIAEVHVTEGQAVKQGDPVLTYDMTLAKLDINMKKLELKTIKNKIVIANRELEKLKNTKPRSETPTVSTPPVTIPTPTPTPSTQQQENTPKKEIIAEKTNNGYNYITESALPYDGDGSSEKPFRYLCNNNCVVQGAFLNQVVAASEPVYIIFEIRNGNKKSGALLYSWSINSDSIAAVNANSQWLVRTHQETAEDDDDEQSVPTPQVTVPAPVIPTSTPEPEEQGLTAAELSQKIKDVEKELLDLDLNKRKAELELKDMRKRSKEGVVKATIDGVVKTVGDLENPSSDGTAFILISGSEGLYVTGALSELMLDQVKIGQIIYATSGTSGQSFEATIEEISKYPSENAMGWGEGNPNVSYYPYVAYIENTEGLNNGDYLDLRMTPTVNADEANVLYLLKEYIREENGRKYVIKSDKDGLLKKQYVETGKSLYGAAIEIKKGLAVTDFVTFPYGKAAKEGRKTKKASIADTAIY
jgi:multidrug resistance efflux pump